MSVFSSFEEENIHYWTNRTAGYSGVNQDELASGQRKVWSGVLSERIHAHFPDRTPRQLRVLDIGTGPGFFAILLAEQGYSVTAVDYTATMLEAAKHNAGAVCQQITFLQMNAEELTFPDNSFDVIVSRNLTWNLHHPEKAYSQWVRVLSPGGLLLNFDANWYRYLRDDQARQGHLRDRDNIASSDVGDETAGTDVAAMEAIALQAPLSAQNRPQWDLMILKSMGMTVWADPQIWERVWTREERINNASTPMFMVEGKKRIHGKTDQGGLGECENM
ncbi:MAG: class I SAM-dependent methyltransferase [Faecousia sp.]